jgi:molybdopterin-guanine dinucleotide biosynthesis protein A
LIALAVDMPFMTAGELGRLVDLATDERGVVPVIGDRVEPMAGIYPAEATEDFQAALAGPDFSLQPVVRQLVAAEKVKLWSVPETATHFYRSVNAPEDLFLEFNA